MYFNVNSLIKETILTMRFGTRFPCHLKTSRWNFPSRLRQYKAKSTNTIRRQSSLEVNRFTCEQSVMLFSQIAFSGFTFLFFYKPTSTFADSSLKPSGTNFSLRLVAMRTQNHDTAGSDQTSQFVVFKHEGFVFESSHGRSPPFGNRLLDLVPYLNNDVHISSITKESK